MNDNTRNQNSSTKNGKRSAIPTGNPLMALMWLIVFVLTAGHPERANIQKIGNRKTDIIVYGTILLIAIAAILYVAIKKP